MKLPLALLAAALLVPVAFPTGSAQAPAEGAVRLLEDPGADVKLDLAGQGQDPSGRWAAADLRSLDVLEEPEAVTFLLTVGALPAQGEAPFLENVEYAIGFRHLDQVYRVALDRQVFVGGGSEVYGALEVYEPSRRQYVQAGPYQSAQRDDAAGTIAFAVERELLTDRNGDIPHPEVPLTDWQVSASGLLSGVRFGRFCPSAQACVPNPFPSAHDAMPDAGNGTVPLVPRFGIAQSGHARLFSEVPTRASNGEATTIVYQVTAANRAPGEEVFALKASGVPAGWNVRLPAQRLTVPGNGSVQLPVLATIPFTHDHGTYQKFLVEMQSLSDARSVGRIQLGIRYVQPPQPAGHHNALWIHAGAPLGPSLHPAADALLFGAPGLYLNALEADPLDSRLDVPGNSCGTDLVPPRMHFCWDMPLRPQLELGLDFDLQRTGTLSVPIKTTLPLQGATLEGRLSYITPGEVDEFFFGYDARAVAEVRPRAAVDVAPNSAGNVLTADIVPTSDGDFVPYQKGAQLYLELELVATGAQVFGGFLGDMSAPAIQPGGTLTDLPLNEYHDKVTQVFSSNATLQLLADGPQDRATNPGKTLLFNLTLQNLGAAGTFELELNGTHLPWARLLAPAPRVRLDAGESVPVRVAVQVPPTADRGDTADLILSATSAADLNVRSLARLYATVETERQYADEAPLVAEAKAAASTPGLGLLLLGPALLALAALARRRLA